MSMIKMDVDVKAPLSTVVENFEAFLWADDKREEEGHTPGGTTAVNKLGRTKFEEVENEDLLGIPMTTTTRYALSATPKGTRITFECQLPAALDMMIALSEAMGVSVKGEMESAAARWSSRLVAYIDLQNQRSGPSAA